jgi:electron transfer flavoprotein beta subunit
VAIEKQDGFVIVTQNLDDRVVVKKVPLPCLICADSEINTPRLPSYRRSLETSEESITVYTLADCPDQDKSHYGLLGSATNVERIFPPEKNTDRKILEGSSEEVSAQIFGLLKNGKYV